MTRPTLRCVTEDLALPIPPANVPLDEIDHPIAAKAVRQFSDPAGPRERIRSVDDQVLYKVKVQRWRGAVWLDTSGTQPWLITAGRREDGSADDFYEALTAAGRANRARYNRTHSPALTTDTHTADLLPGRDDLDRYRAEEAVRLIRTIRDTVEDLTRASLLDGKEHTGTAAGTGIGILVRADDGHETYVAVRITGPAPQRHSHHPQPRARLRA